MNTPVLAVGTAVTYGTAPAIVIDSNAPLEGWTTEVSPYVSIEFTPRRVGAPRRDIITARADMLTVVS